MQALAGELALWMTRLPVDSAAVGTAPAACTHVPGWASVLPEHLSRIETDRRTETPKAAD